MDGHLYGVDLNSRKIAIAGWEDKVAVARVYEVPRKVINRVTVLRDLFTWMTASAEPEDVFFVETPLVGRNVKSSMMVSETYGVVLAALGVVGARVYPANNKSWKLEVVGNGNATKDDTRAWLRENDRPLARLCGDDSDLVDAAGIGYYGRRVRLRATRVG